MGIFTGRKFFAVFLSITLLLPAIVSARNPNIIMIYTDDMGYSDISSFSNTDLPVRTPNIDRLATGGMKFTHFYVAMPICSPSRAAVLSGMFSPRNQFTNFLNTRDGNRQSDQNDYMDPVNAYLPRSFQAAGYLTAHVGKWHMGGGRDIDDAPTIRQYGYDEVYSTWESPNPDPQLGVGYTPWDFNNLEPGQVPRHQRTEYMVNRTLDILSRHPNQSCFITLWPDDLHTPFTPSPALIAKYGGSSDGANTRPNFYGVLEEYDRQIGRLLDGIAQRGLENDTIIFFTGDNGPSPDFDRERTNGMKGRKLSLYEGGIRQPFLIQWKGHIPAGVTNSQTVISTVDLLPSLTALAGIPMLLEGVELTDGEDLSDAMLGTPVTRTKPLFWEYGRTPTVPRPGVNNAAYSPVLAMREGDYKLLMNPDGSSIQLYNVRTNPNETSNLAGQNQAVVDGMKPRLLAWHASLPHRDHPYPRFQTVDFQQYAVSEFQSALALQQASGAGSTLKIDGIASAPNSKDDVFAVHFDLAEKSTFLRLNEMSGTITKVTDSDQIRTELGISFAGVRTMRAGFEYSPAGDRLFFSENSTQFPNQVLVAATNVGTRFSRQIARSADLAGLSDFSIQPNGIVTGAIGMDGNRTVGTLVPATGTWTPRISEANLKAKAPGTSVLAPEAIGVNNSNGESFVFAHGDGELFHINNANNVNPILTRQTQALLANVDLHDIVTDQAGNMYGYDVAGNQIVVIRAGDRSVFGISLETIASRLGNSKTLVPTPWRGLTARMVDSTHADLYIASSTPDYGILKLRFGTFPAAVANWTLY